MGRLQVTYMNFLFSTLQDMMKTYTSYFLENEQDYKIVRLMLFKSLPSVLFMVGILGEWVRMRKINLMLIKHFNTGSL